MTNLFINEYCYSDVHSWQVLEVNEGKAIVQRVKRSFKPEFAAGGFAAVCTNIDEQEDAPIVAVGEPFEVINKNGVWGHWVDAEICSVSIKLENLEKVLERNPNARLTDPERCIVTWYIGFKKNGKPKQKFVVLGKMTDHCGYYYDYNF